MRRRLLGNKRQALITSSLYNGLIAGYHLNGNFTDFVGTQHGTNSGATSTSGKLNGAYSFPSGAYMDTGSKQLIGGKSAFTFAVWTKILSGAGGALANSWGSPRSYGFTQNTSNQWIGYIYVDGTIKGGNFYPPTDILWNNSNQWYLVIFQWDGSTFRCFVDNQESTNSYPVTGTSVSVGGLNEKLGSGYTEPNRDIDEALYWNRALTPEERTSLWNNGSGIEL